MNRIKKGDNIIVLSGKDKGKQAKVLAVRPKDDKAIVEGVNMVKRRQRPRRQGEKGATVSVPSPIDLSNITLYCGKCKKGVRVGFQGEGKDKRRVCVKCRNKI